jgi:glycosyltransferase involved in cell wall biosynthesis
MKVYIDSACDIHYSSFYIRGIEQYFGKNKIVYKNKPFSDFHFNNHFFAFIIKRNLEEKKIIIDYADTSEVDKKALKWSDLYCKINIDEENDYSNNKIISIGPSFGINVYSYTKTIYLASLNFIKSYKRINNKRNFFSSYKAQLNRPKIENYYPFSEKENYIYFVGSLWKKERKTNRFRANFIKACLSSKIKFEGGFAPRTKKDIQGYEDITMKARHDMDTFIEKTKKSIITFNTPAVLDCHGWKLAEFLCFGKVIISTPLSRNLPKELRDKKHIVITDGSQEDIKIKLEKLIRDKRLRNTLKINARQYFENELAPIKVIQKIKNYVDNNLDSMKN